MKKVSFDFDGTLSNKHVQKLAQKLIRAKYDVHVVTSRPEFPERYHRFWDNSDLYLICNNLRIKKKNIHFTEYKPKFYFFKDNPDFLFHLDDDDMEIMGINENTKTKGILFDINWENNCKLKLMKS
jgi:hypothetical protein